MENPKFAPRDIFEQILQWTVIATFDLIIRLSDGKIIIAKRKIAPYQSTWALPGLRMLKGEQIDDTIRRIAKDELGVAIDPKSKKFIGQYVGRFKTENNRQDVSTCYQVDAMPNSKITLNASHFSSFTTISRLESQKMGAMYAYYLKIYFGGEV